MDNKGRVIEETIHCSSAEEFLDALSPIGKYFKDYSVDTPLLFRGQGQDWSLVPSLFRDNSLENLSKHASKGYNDLLLVERDILIRFFRIADKRGLVLPDDTQNLRDFFEILLAKYWNGNVDQMERIEHEALSVMALAQHYGIPTRLLDWTRHPYIAAFFAAEDAYKDQLKSKPEYECSSDLVVWFFYLPVLGKKIRYEKDSYFVRGVTAPSATNINLKAQQGVFTLANRKYTGEVKNKPYKALDKLLLEEVKYNQINGVSDYWVFDAKFRKFTLPISKSTYLLYLLAKQDITPSAIYPGYESIVSDLNMEHLFGTF